MAKTFNEWKEMAELAQELGDVDAELEAREAIENMTVSQTESGLRGAAQGASLGFADEITGGVSALYDVATTEKELSDIPDLYTQRRDESRAAYKEAEEQNPISYGAGQVAGGVASMAVPGLGGANLAKLGATGAAYGLGASEEEDISGMAKDAALGGLVGAGGGAVAKQVGNVAKRGLSSATNKARDVIDDVAVANYGGDMATSGLVAKGIDKIGKVGDQADKILGGGSTASRVLGQAGGYAINPAVGAAMTTSTAAKYLPTVASKTSYVAGDTLDYIIPKMGKYSAPLMEAAQRGGNSLAATHFIMQQQDPEYRQQYEQAVKEQDDE